MIRASAVFIALATGAAAQDVSPEGLIGYIDHCATSMETGDFSGFDDLTVETEVTTDTTTIRGWRGGDHPGFVVSLIRRAGIGMCDIAFAPSPGSEGSMDAVGEMVTAFWDNLLNSPENAPDPDGMGNAVMTCVRDLPVSIFVDVDNLDKGFNAQVARISPTKIKCGDSDA